MPSVNVGTLPPQVQQRYNSKILSTPERNTIHNLFSTPVRIEDMQGNIDRQSRYEALDRFPVPVDNTQTNPPSQLLNRVDIDCRVRNYSTYIVITKDVLLTNEDPILNSAAARLGQATRETEDILQRDNLESSAALVNCVAGGNGDLPTQISVDDTDDIVALLQDNDGDFITNMIEATDKIGTSSIGDSYAAMCTTRMIPSLNKMDDFIRKFRYPNVKDTLTSEWGGINNIRFFVSSQGSVTPNASLLGNDVANIFITAKEGYKVATRDSGDGRYIYLPPGYNNDPCKLRATVATNFYQGQCIDQDLWVQKLRATGLRAI